MMTNEEKLATAKRCGLHVPMNTPHYEYDAKLLAYTSAIEEKYQAQNVELQKQINPEMIDHYEALQKQIAMDTECIERIRNKAAQLEIENAEMQQKIAEIRTAWHINMLRLFPEKSHEEIAKAIEAVSGKSGLDAFIAEVKAGALEEAANKIFVPENGWGEWSIQHAHRDLRELAAELRSQEEGKDWK